MLGCKPSPNGDASSIPRTSDQPFSHKIIHVPVVISELHFILFLNFYIKPSGSWISDLEKKNPHKVLKDLLLFAPQLRVIICDPLSSVFPYTPLQPHWTAAPRCVLTLAVTHSLFSLPRRLLPGRSTGFPPPPSSFSLNVSFSLRSSLNSPFKFEAAHHPSSQFPAFFFSVILSTTQTSRRLRRLLTCFLSFSLH